METIVVGALTIALLGFAAALAPGLHRTHRARQRADRRRGFLG